MELRIETILIDIIETILPRSSSDNVILTFGLKLQWTYYEKNGNNNIFGKDILIAIHRPSNYTKVLTHVITGDKDFFKLTNNGTKVIFNLESDHDSCWRSDGFSFLFDVWMEAEKYFSEKFGKDIRNKHDISTSHNFGLFGGKPKIFNVTVDKVPDEDRKYKILFLNEMKIRFE